MAYTPSTAFSFTDAGYTPSTAFTFADDVVTDPHLLSLAWSRVIPYQAIDDHFLSLAWSRVIPYQEINDHFLSLAWTRDISGLDNPFHLLSLHWSRVIPYQEINDHFLSLAWFRETDIIATDPHLLSLAWSRIIPYQGDASHILQIGYSLLGAALPAATGMRVYARITGSAESPPLPDLPIAVSSVEATLLRGTESSVRCVAPNAVALIDAIAARQNGRLILSIYRLFADGTEAWLRDVDIKFTEYRYSIGARAASVSVNGSGIVQWNSAKEVSVPSVVRRSRQLSGSTPQVLLEMDGLAMNHIAPGDVLTYQGATGTDTGTAVRLSWSLNISRFAMGATIR